MKNETARREIESLDYYLQNHTDDYSEESHTAMMMAIDALNNADILDKIRAEIEQMIAESERAIRPFDGMETVIYTNGFKDGIGSAIDVIDKYR